MQVLKPGLLLLALTQLIACGDRVVGWPIDETVAPTVVATLPPNDASDVDPGTTVSVFFSEAMDPDSISLDTLTLSDGTTAVAGTVDYDGVVATFVPTSPLAPGVLYTGRVTTGATDLVGNALANDFVWSFRTTIVADETPPQVSSTVPASGATEVAVNALISATFSEPMAPATISGTSVTIMRGTTPVSGTVSYVGLTATFDPTDVLAPSTSYTVRITTAATDLSGLGLAQDYVWSFTTGTIPDATRPMVSSTTPANLASNVALNAPITATFSEPMAPGTLNTTTFTVMQGTTPVPGTVIFVGVTALFTPVENLAGNTVYTATITDDATDLAGNTMAADYVWTFTTGTAPDETAPQVSATVPLSGAIGVPVAITLAATFTEPMNPLTVTTTSFTLRLGNTLVPGAVTYVGVTATFDPTTNLLPSTSYTATISDTVTDLAGNPMAQDYVWTFTTGATPDLTQPLVSATTPLNLATAVAVNSGLTATFSEAMNPLTLTSATFTLSRGATPVAGAVTYAGVTASFDPTVDLLPNTLYTATITNLASDLSGLRLPANYVWTFTTGPTPDTAPPRVTFTLPADDATAVLVNASIVAFFSEAMDPLTLTTANFTVQQLGVVVPGTVTYANGSATFVPTTSLPANTTFSATVTTGARDLAGNALVENYAWNFRTGGVVDATNPSVIATNPVHEANNVLLDTLVVATFDEVMNPLSLTTLTFTLKDGNVLIPGAVTTLGTLSTFDPTNELEPNTEYTATITTGATDLAGNPLSGDFIWTFTTGALIDELDPTVVLTNPADLEIDVAIDSAVNATFSEAMNPLAVTTSTFIVTDPEGIEVLGTVFYDILTDIATFDPLDDLMPNTTYTATITTESTDLAGNALFEDEVWTFTTSEEIILINPPINLRSLSSFVAVAGSGLTNSNSSGPTVLNGDVGLNPTASCLGDGSPCTITNPIINGTLYANDPGGIAAQAKVDLTAAYVEAMARPIGTTVNDITGMILAPGVYTSNSTMSIAVGGTVTLDGQGDSNAVFIFQIGSSLTVNNNSQILLINGARAKNVFWAIFASSTIGSNVSFAGSVLAGASNSVGTDSVVVGRLLATTGALSLLSNTITLPPL